MLNYIQYQSLLTDAKKSASQEDFLSGHITLLPDMDPAAALCLLRDIWDYHSASYEAKITVAHRAMGVSRTQFAKMFDVPLRNLENWEAHIEAASHRRPPKGLPDLLMFAVLSVKYDENAYYGEEEE